MINWKNETINLGEALVMMVVLTGIATLHSYMLIAFFDTIAPIDIAGYLNPLWFGGIYGITVSGFIYWHAKIKNSMLHTVIKPYCGRYIFLMISMTAMIFPLYSIHP